MTYTSVKGNKKNPDFYVALVSSAGLSIKNMGTCLFL